MMTPCELFAEPIPCPDCNGSSRIEPGSERDCSNCGGGGMQCPICYAPAEDNSPPNYPPDFSCANCGWPDEPKPGDGLDLSCHYWANRLQRIAEDCARICREIVVRKIRDRK